MNIVNTIIWQTFFINPIKSSSKKTNDPHIDFIEKKSFSFHPFSSIQNDYDGEICVYELVSRCMKYILQSDTISTISPDVISILLQESNDSTEPFFSKRTSSSSLRPNFSTDKVDNRHYIIKGIPYRPYYQELSWRIIALSRLYYDSQHINILDDGAIKNYDGNLKPLPRPLIDAHYFGFTECDPPQIYPLNLTKNEPLNVCIKEWLDFMSDEGIFELLGFRRTVGTEHVISLPDMKCLLQSTKVINKGNSKCQLTVAGRARAKHAHRTQQNSFYGIVKGSVQDQNNAAETIIQCILQEAMWVNIHRVGGIQDLILEVRVLEGYGARWGLRYFDNRESFCDVVFRGFLEPHMKDGFERRWRH